MTQYNTLNVKFSNSQLNRLKSGIKNDTQVTLSLSSNAVSDSINETYFQHKLLLTKTQVSKICKAFANNSSANIALSKTQLSKMVQLGEFLGRLREPLLRTSFSLMKNVFKPLAKSDLILLGLTAAASATNAATQKKVFGSGMTTLIISNEEMDDVMKIIKSIEESGLLIKGVSETIKKH